MEFPLKMIKEKVLTKLNRCAILTTKQNCKLYLLVAYPI